MVKTVGKGLAAKKDRTPEEDDMLDMMLHGGERVKAENLSAILDWYRASNKCSLGVFLTPAFVDDFPLS